MVFRLTILMYAAVMILLIACNSSPSTTVNQEPSPTPESASTGTPNQRAFFEDVLDELDIEGSEFALDALVQWAAWENTSASWNPLATTWDLLDRSSNFNRVGVKDYFDRNAGIEATAKTLRKSEYDAIRTMLMQESFTRNDVEQALNTWSYNGGYVSALLTQWENSYEVYASISEAELQQDTHDSNQESSEELSDIKELLASLGFGENRSDKVSLSEEENASNSPWFYNVSMEDITEIGVTHEGRQVSFYKTGANTWAFTDPAGIPPDNFRWGGMTLIFSGPKTNRDLADNVSILASEITNPAQYGLDDPSTILDLGLTADRKLQYRLGDRTTDGRYFYGEVAGFPQLFLIAASWGDVVSRLATEPPIPKWYVRRTTNEIVEFNLFSESSPESGDTSVLRFTKNDNDTSWGVQNFATESEALPVDESRFNEVYPLVQNMPDYISVAIPVVINEDYTPWGIDDFSKAVEIRFASTSGSGVRFIDGVLLLLGNRTVDGQSYYAKNVDDSYKRQPVLTIEAEWVDSLFELYEDIPYAVNQSR